ncbi:MULTISPECIES: nitroreductase [unclassified Streptomyces]|uniref:nitroreductase n=1 Tax=unclassified Streptomyces TaxID=2593676 RepID=UPI0004C98FD3|nr:MULTISPECIES: nitroreductase [unclassified Streptomyces]KOX01644.1 nitroreductase [Streptomyces sp. NRRL WC-3723]
MNHTPATAPAPAPAPAPPRGTVEDALRSRRSVRAFLPTPVPRSTVERLLTLAARSASNSNCQPWQVHVVTGAAKRSLTADLLRAHADGDGRGRDYDYQPEQDAWREPFRSRRRRFGEGLYRDTLGIVADDIGARLDHHRRNYDFFGAPVGIILTTSRHPLQSALVDAGLFLQALMLASRADGLDTCPQASLIDFSPVLRRHLLIPDDQLIVCGIALGYADPAHRLNRLRTPREPVGSFATFHGDEAE